MTTGGTRVTWFGMDHWEHKLSELPVAVRLMAAREMTEGAHSMMGDSLREAPIDTGRLRSSGHVGSPSVHVFDVIVDAGYHTDYAVFVHENEMARHNPPTKAKFLRDPAYHHAPAVFERLREGLVRTMMGT